jgi:phage shock protein PspC (stress-responsive transcriptional regulator)
MNKVITINLNGNAFPLEETGYEALRAYLETAGRRLGGNPDRAEIIADIEQAIADRFRSVLGPGKTVVLTAEVERVLAEMGPVEDDSAAADAPSPGAAGAEPPGGTERTDPPPPAGPAGKARRLYRIPEGAMIGGVCNGLASYFNVNVTLIRILFVLTLGLGVAWYVLMMFIVPLASTTEEKAAASGEPSTAEEFIRRAKQGYYEGMRTFHDKAAHRAWKQRFKREMRGWKRDFKWEMRRTAWQWHHGWAPPPQPGLLAWIIVPVISVLIWLLALAAVIAVLSLLLTGAIFGVVPPPGVPWWLALILLLVAYQILAWPLKVLRYSFLPHGLGWGAPGGGGAVWLAILIAVIWVANRHVPEVHQALQDLPPLIHHAADTVQAWWARR